MVANSSAHFLLSGVFIQFIRTNIIKHPIFIALQLIRFLDHTQLDTYTHTHTVGLLWPSDHLVAVTVTYTTHKEHKKRTSTPSAGFEPAIPGTNRLKT